MAVVIVTCDAQTPTETTLRTLNLPPEYSIVDGFITDYKVSNQLIITKNVDQSKSVKNISSTGKVTYSNATTTWAYETKQIRDELTNSGTYLPNFVDFQFSGAEYINPGNVYEIVQDRIDPTNSGSWIAGSTFSIDQLNDQLILLTSITEIGGNCNVIPRTFVKRVGSISYYKNPVDYLGRPIIGDTLYNNGVPATSLVIKFANRITRLTQVTKTKVGSGTWTSSTGVWSGGVKTYTSTTSVYVPVADLPQLFGSSIADLENETRTEIYCTPLNPNTYITSTSTEIVTAGNLYTGITYYSGIDARLNKPSGKITSYNKTYPGHVQRWILKQWHPDGTVVGSGSYGQAWMLQLNGSEDSAITIVPGNQTSYNATTKTLTYNSSLTSELWYTFEELPAQGKNWSGETIMKL